MSDIEVVENRFGGAAGLGRARGGATIVASGGRSARLSTGAWVGDGGGWGSVSWSRAASWMSVARSWPAIVSSSPGKLGRRRRRCRGGTGRP